jgi:hypothetical protein
LNGTEIYDPATATFSAAGNNEHCPRRPNCNAVERWPRVELLVDATEAGAQATTEIFDPVTGTFASGTKHEASRVPVTMRRFLPMGAFCLRLANEAGSAEILVCDFGATSRQPVQ